MNCQCQKNPPADWGLEHRLIQREEVSSKSGNIGQQYRHFFAQIFAGRSNFVSVKLSDPEVYEFLRLRKEYSDSRCRGVPPNRSNHKPLFNKGLDPLGKDSLYGVDLQSPSESSVSGLLKPL